MAANLAPENEPFKALLASSLGQPMKSDLNELRKCFADELLSASADGRLDTILQAQNQVQLQGAGMFDAGS